MVRVAHLSRQVSLPESLINRWMDGKKLDLMAFLWEFRQFWRKNADVWTERYEYKGAAPHLIL
ncbi:MAG: hypothetical protein LBU64_09550 [Planctomycetota bacterium]|jgi:hypothetical protein|nr:hypothetical protein [Planctomycetota bacterium]